MGHCDGQRPCGRLNRAEGRVTSDSFGDGNPQTGADAEVEATLGRRQGRGPSPRLDAGNSSLDVLNGARLSHPGQHPRDSHSYLFGNQRCRVPTNTRPRHQSGGHLLEVLAPGSSLGGCSHFQLWGGPTAVRVQRDPHRVLHTGQSCWGAVSYKDSALHRWAPPRREGGAGQAAAVSVCAFRPATQRANERPRSSPDATRARRSSVSQQTEPAEAPVSPPREDRTRARRRLCPARPHDSRLGRHARVWSTGIPWGSHTPPVASHSDDQPGTFAPESAEQPTFLVSPPGAGSPSPWAVPAGMLQAPELPCANSSTSATGGEASGEGSSHRPLPRPSHRPLRGVSAVTIRVGAAAASRHLVLQTAPKSPKALLGLSPLHEPAWHQSARVTLLPQPGERRRRGAGTVRHSPEGAARGVPGTPLTPNRTNGGTRASALAPSPPPPARGPQTAETPSTEPADLGAQLRDDQRRNNCCLPGGPKACRQVSPGDARARPPRRAMEKNPRKPCSRNGTPLSSKALEPDWGTGNRSAISL